MSDRMSVFQFGLRVAGPGGPHPAGRALLVPGRCGDAACLRHAGPEGGVPALFLRAPRLLLEDLDVGMMLNQDALRGLPANAQTRTGYATNTLPGSFFNRASEPKRDARVL